MTLDWQDRRWHTRLYLWAEPVVAKFFDSYSRINTSDGVVRTNLCPYMRTLLVWLPLAFVANLATVVAAVATVTYIPGRLFGWDSYFTALGTLSGLIVVVKLISWGVQTYQRWSRQRVRKESAPPKRYEDPTPGFGTALRAYSRRAHDGICPGITITRAKLGDTAGIR